MHHRKIKTPKEAVKNIFLWHIYIYIYIYIYINCHKIKSLQIKTLQYVKFAQILV